MFRRGPHPTGVRLLRYGVGVCCAIACWLSFASRAAASCGDYLTLGGDWQGHAAMFDGPLAERPADARRAHHPVTPHVPCHGPNCSRGNLPPASPPAPVTLTIEQTACLKHADSPHHGASRCLDLDPSLRVPFGEFPPVLRPPRRSSLSA